MVGKFTIRPSASPQRAFLIFTCYHFCMKIESEYEITFFDLLKSGDYSRGLDFVVDVIKNGKPKPPERDIQAILEGFQPLQSINLRADWLCNEIEKSQKESPDLAVHFNALVIHIHHFDQAESFVDLVHWNPETKEIKEIYWEPGDMNLTFQDDWKDSFQFAADLQTKYAFTYKDQTISGEMIHYHLRVAILICWLQSLINVLASSPHWERITKADPFSFFVASVPREDTPSNFFIEIIPKARI